MDGKGFIGCPAGMSVAGAVACIGCFYRGRTFDAQHDEGHFRSGAVGV